MLDAEEAYQQYRDMVYGYLIRLCRNRDLAEELTQETFYQAVKNRKQYELYDNKICTGEEAAECRGCMGRRVASVGYELVTERGDAV